MSTTDQGSLSKNSIGLAQGVFQALTHMGPAAGVASSLLVAVSFAGAATPLAVVLTLAVVLLVGVAIGSLARVFSTAGGLADYAERVFGPRAGVFVSWLYAPLELLIAPIVLIFFGKFVSDTLDTTLHVSFPWWGVVIITAAFICFINIRGVKQSTTAGLVLGTAEIVIFVGLAVWILVVRAQDATLAVFDPGNAITPGWSGIFKAVVFSILAFQGFETAAPLAEETRDPRRTIPRTVMYSALGCGAFYLLCSYAAVLGWGFGTMGTFASSASPWIDLARTFWGPAWILILFALLNSFVGNINAGTIAASRIVFSLGRSGRLPAQFGRIHPVHATPAFTIYVQTGFSVVLAILLGSLLGPLEAFTLLGALITVLAIIIYAITCLACIRYYAKVPNKDLQTVALRIVAPAVAVVILLAPLYFQFFPWPSYPASLGNLAAIILVAVAAVSALLPASGRRDGAGDVAVPVPGELSPDAAAGRVS